MRVNQRKVWLEGIQMSSGPAVLSVARLCQNRPGCKLNTHLRVVSWSLNGFMISYLPDQKLKLTELK